MANYIRSSKVATQAPRLQEDDTRPFTEPWDFGDVTFIIEDKRLYVNKGVLSMSSEVFRAMFTSEFKEREMKEILLLDKKFDDFLQLMLIVHPQTLRSLDECNIYRIRPLADEYQIKHVYERCVKALSDGPPSILSFNIAEVYKLTSLHDKCLKYLKDTPLSKLESEAGFKELNQDILMGMLPHKCKKYEADMTKIKGIADWEYFRHFGRCSDGCCNAGNRNCAKCAEYRFKEISEIVNNL